MNLIATSPKPTIGTSISTTIDATNAWLSPPPEAHTMSEHPQDSQDLNEAIPPSIPTDITTEADATSTNNTIIEAHADPTPSSGPPNVPHLDQTFTENELEPVTYARRSPPPYDFKIGYGLTLGDLINDKPFSIFVSSLFTFMSQ